MCVCVCVCLCVSLDPTAEQVGSAEEEQFEEVDQPLYPRNRSGSPSAGERLRMILPETTHTHTQVTADSGLANFFQDWPRAGKPRRKFSKVSCIQPL